MQVQVQAQAQTHNNNASAEEIKINRMADGRVENGEAYRGLGLRVRIGGAVGTETKGMTQRTCLCEEREKASETEKE